MERESQMRLDGPCSPGTERRDGAVRLRGWLLEAARHEAGRTSRSVLPAGSGIGQVAQPAAAVALTTITANPVRVGGGSRFTTGH
jgi:hypothetical protein